MKAVTKKILSAFGLDVRLIRNIRRHDALTWENKQDAMWRPFLSHRDIRTVIDLGANHGQFAAMIHRQCPKARVFSFEPLPSCHPDLNRVLNSIPGSRMFPFAVGAEPQQIQMQCSEYTPCSSLLPGTKELETAHAGAANVRPLDVTVVRVDDALKDEPLPGEILVKLDVQGYEIPAIQGALTLLNRSVIVVVEVCFFRQLYEGQPLFHEIYEQFRELGFTFMGFPEQYHRENDGRIVEADAVFERLET